MWMFVYVLDARAASLRPGCALLLLSSLPHLQPAECELLQDGMMGCAGGLTGADWLWDSSLSKPRHRFAGRRDCSTHTRHQPGIVSAARPRVSLVSLTCFWHLASLKLFFCIQAETARMSPSSATCRYIITEGVKEYLEWHMLLDGMADQTSHLPRVPIHQSAKPYYRIRDTNHRLH